MISLPLSLSPAPRSNAYFNSVAMIDADGTNLGVYRKSHIPDSPGYHEKWHFSPGDTGFRVFDTAHGRIGVGICWDQWFPEAARCMALAGAEILVYPTAIGSEPQDSALDSSGHWQRTMQGHAAANIVPVVASNRIGCERSLSPASDRQITFYGSSFIADHTGLCIAQAPRNNPDILVHTFNLDEIAAYRRSWGVFRDRRPDLYGPIVSLSGNGAAACQTTP
jgi:N-carbamoylputrescine amidase